MYPRPDATLQCMVWCGRALSQASTPCLIQHQLQRAAKASHLDHAIDLACTHGLSLASAYLRNQRLRNDTIARVLSAPRDLHRQHEFASIPPELPYTSEVGDASETPVRQLSYSSRLKFRHLR